MGNRYVVVCDWNIKTIQEVYFKSYHRKTEHVFLWMSQLLTTLILELQCNPFWNRTLESDRESYSKIAGKSGSRAIFKVCSQELQGLVDRMKKHSEISKRMSVDFVVEIPEEYSVKNSENVGCSSSSLSSHHTVNNDLEKYVVRTSKKDKEIFDEQVTRFFFATNLAFHKVQHEKFKKLCQQLHTGYVPAHEKLLVNELLDTVFRNDQQKCHENLRGETVCLTLDGWSNGNNACIICMYVLV